MDHKLYLSDPGIFKKNGKYYSKTTNKEITNSVVTSRLNRLSVPPAWRGVWYASTEKCHIQVYGTDQNGKKQYILSEKWTNCSRAKKFIRMKNFIKDLPVFKKKIKDRTKLINLVFNLLLDTHIRVGNEIYAEKNDTYGLTTLRQKHLVLKDGKYSFSFIGKSKREQFINISNEYNVYLDKLIQKDKNKPLFPGINSDILNAYLKEHMGREYTCKDFRTYSANILFIKAFLKKCKSGLAQNKVIIESIDESAAMLGHTRNICKKSYISNNLLDYCRDNYSISTSLGVIEMLSKASG